MKISNYFKIICIFLFKNICLGQEPYYKGPNKNINSDSAYIYYGDGTYLLSQNGCLVYCRHIKDEYSYPIWKGNCKNGYAEGTGELLMVKHFPSENVSLSYSAYVGNLKKGKKDGYGTQYLNKSYEWEHVFSYMNYKKYIGEFKNDYREGQGTFYFNYSPDFGIWKKGIFRRGELFTGDHYNKQGELVYKYSNGQTTYDYKKNQVAQQSRSSSSSSSSSSLSSSSSNNNNAEMERRLNLQRPCKLRKGEVTDWNYSDPNESPNWRYLKFTVYKPKDNGDYEEIDAELELRVYRAGNFVLSSKTDQVYYLVSRPNGSESRYEKPEEALERMVKNCGCENGVVMK